MKWLYIALFAFNLVGANYAAYKNNLNFELLYLFGAYLQIQLFWRSEV